MKIKGINYDVGMGYSGPTSRPFLTKETVNNELDIIKNKLNCNAIRIYSGEISRLAECSKIALEKGLEVWFSPRFLNMDKEVTIKLVEAAAIKAEELRKKYKKVVFIVGNELTIDSKGFALGENYKERVDNLFNKKVIKFDVLSNKLNNYLVKLVRTVSKIFKGKITYASGDWERINWKLFDIIGVNKYLTKWNKGKYVSELRELKKFKKPVAITEFGSGSFVGASDLGGAGWLIVDWSKKEIKENYKRSEEEQASYIKNLLKLFEREGVYASFVFTFIESNSIYVPDNPKKDLDMACFGIMKVFGDGHSEFKKAAKVISEFYKK